METAALQQLTRDACTRMGGQLWPNVLGFAHHGWSYTYQETVGRWCAVRVLKYARVIGEGETPEEARTHAAPEPR